MLKIPTTQQLQDATGHGNHKFEAVSLFAGGGGSSLGYRMAGGKVLAINEFIKVAADTYRANWPNTIIIDKDIRNLDATELLKTISKQVGELDLLDGSPPCASFSTAGKREKGWGEVHAYSETRQRTDDLFFEFNRILAGVQPRAFVAENVTGLMKGEARLYFDAILEALRSSGYIVEWKALNAKDFGVPQNRPRVFFVGIRQDLWRDEWQGRLHPIPPKLHIPLVKAFEGLTLTPKDMHETTLSNKSLEQLNDTNPGKAHNKRFTLYKGHPHKVSNCITASVGKKGAAAPKHWDNRAYSIAELKRITGVPDDYQLVGTYAQQAERLGRMVAPPVMRAIASNLLRLGVFDDSR